MNGKIVKITNNLYFSPYNAIVRWVGHVLNEK